MSMHVHERRGSLRPGFFGARMLTCGAIAAAACVSLVALGCEESRAPAKTTQTSTITDSTPDTNRPISPPSVPGSAASESAQPAAEVAPPPPAKAAEPAAAPAVEDSAPRNITFDKIKFELKANADYKPELLTPEIKALDGHNVRIRGFMFPSFKATGLTEWVLVRDNMQCCFGGNAILYDCIIVDMKPGKSTDYTTRPVAVEGKFEIRDWLDVDGVRRAIYHLDGEAVRF